MHRWVCPAVVHASDVNPDCEVTRIDRVLPLGGYKV